MNSKDGGKTVAITSAQGVLVGHYFDTEKEALKTLPYIKRWKRETFDTRYIRYHSPEAEKFWEHLARNGVNKFRSTSIYYKNGEKKYEYK